MAAAQAQLDGFIAKYSPAVAAQGRAEGKHEAIVIKSISARQRPRRPAQQAVKKK